MWSHYADSHRGFVLGFDESHDFFRERELPKTLPQPPRRLLRNGEAAHGLARAGFRSSIFAVVFTKPTDGAMSRRFRLIHQIKRGQQRLPFPLDALKR